MTLAIPTPEQAKMGLRAVKTVVTAARPLDPTRRALIVAAQKHFLRVEADVDALDRVDPDALAAAVPEPVLREQLAHALCLYVMVPDEVDRAELAAAQRFAEALGAGRDAIARMRAVYENRLIALRFDAMRSSFVVDSIRRRVRDDGALTLLKGLGAVLGVYENEAVAARYRALGELPEGTLGRAFFEFYTQNGFPFPGEKGGAPEAVVTHDLTHVLSGYTTDMHGEACTVAFQAGYRREGAFGGLLFVLLNAQKGMRMTQLAPGATHMLEEPGMPERLVAAWVRGGAVTTDLTADWDYWRDLERPLDEVRARLDVKPA
jgi:hypothetical protein